ncbi:hypothetical protein FACS1894151_03140 [Spirochaetia bacterium]|nr:hypothetical protein FACS1894151_03140 [Spirochaetia bacterium]
MKLFFQYCLHGFSNCYVIGSEYDEKAENPSYTGLYTKERTAIIVDPGNMNLPTLNFIEQHNYKLRAVLVTHAHKNHVHGLKTLKSIYDADIYAIDHIIADFRTMVVKDGDSVQIGPFTVEVISVPGHSADSVAFRIDKLLFTGDALTAGLVGGTASTYGAAIQMTALRSRLLSLPGDLTVLPGHGPPTSLKAERCFNASIQTFDQRKNHRQAIDLDFLGYI